MKQSKLTHKFPEQVKAYQRVMDPELARHLIEESYMEVTQKSELFVNKTIHSIEWENDGSEGFANLVIHFTDNTSVKINYSCMGGVYISE